MPPTRAVVEALAAVVAKLEKGGLEPLTSREHDVAAGLLSGLRGEQIAASLQIALKTVRTHIEHVHQKLRVSTNAEACVTLILQTLLPGCRPGHRNDLRSRLHPPRAATAEHVGRGMALTSLLTPPGKKAPKRLSRTEAVCMALLLRGCGDKQIADPLGVAPGTVCALVRRARLKLGHPTRAAAAAALALQTALALGHPRCSSGLSPRRTRA